MPPDVLDRLGKTQDRLNDAEQRLIEALLGRRQELVFLSGPQLAAQMQMHGAVPTRLAQKLGYKGFPELRAALQKDMLKAQDAALRMRRSVEAVTEGAFLADLVAGEIAALQTLSETVGQPEIDRAADAIFAARKVFIYAQGHAQAIAHFLQRRLDRFGLTTVPLEGRGRDVAERLVSLGANDAVVALAFRKQPRGFAPMMAHAQRAGAVTVLVSDLAGHAMTPPADILLAAPRGRTHSEFQTPTVPFAIVNAILLTMAARHEAATIGALERLSGLFSDFEED